MSANLHDVAVELVPTLQGASATTGNVPDLMDALRRAEEDARARYEDDLENALLKWLDSLNLDPDDKQTCVTELVEALHSHQVYLITWADYRGCECDQGR